MAQVLAFRNVSMYVSVNAWRTGRQLHCKVSPTDVALRTLWDNNHTLCCGLHFTSLD